MYFKHGFTLGALSELSMWLLLCIWWSHKWYLWHCLNPYDFYCVQWSPKACINQSSYRKHQSLKDEFYVHIYPKHQSFKVEFYIHVYPKYQSLKVDFFVQTYLIRYTYLCVAPWRASLPWANLYYYVNTIVKCKKNWECWVSHLVYTTFVKDQFRLVFSFSFSFSKLWCSWGGVLP